MGRVEVRGLTKQFGSEVAVAGIDFEVPEGHFVTLLGPSGCGKTTTLRCLAGLECPDAGEIYIDDQCVAAPEQNLWVPPEQRDIGMVFQSYAVWPHLTVYDNVAYGLRVRRIGRSEIAKRTHETLELVGLHGFADRYATQLSGGQQQRVSLARALAYNPRVILFDEPFSNLDAKLREHMWLELTRLQQRLGITAVYVTHDQSEALVMSDTIIVMNPSTPSRRVGSWPILLASPICYRCAWSHRLGQPGLQALKPHGGRLARSDAGIVCACRWGAMRC